MAYKTGLHRAAVVVRVISWIWMAVGVVVVGRFIYLAAQNGTWENPAVFFVIFALTGAVGIWIAWIIDGFALKEGQQA